LERIDEISKLSLIESDVISDGFVRSDDDDNDDDEDGKDDDDNRIPAGHRREKTWCGEVRQERRSRSSGHYLG
jgi:hypothetical protein